MLNELGVNLYKDMESGYDDEKQIEKEIREVEEEEEDEEEEV